MITFNDPINLRQIILCSTLSERPVQIEHFHEFENPQGIRSYEIKFLRLIEKISNGVKVEINKSGTFLKYYPGIITNNGGQQIEIDCGLERSISYYLEYLLIFALFGKTRLQITLLGLTNEEIDQSVDSILNVTLPLLKYFGIEEQVQLKINKRGFRPEGGGEVYLSCPIVRFLRACDISNKGKIKRIRGVCSSSKVSPQISNTIISAARDVLQNFIPDVWINTDQCKGQKAGNSSGYHLCLVAETTSGHLISIDECFDPSLQIDQKNQNKPEKLGERSGLRMLDEIMHCGVVDSNNQSFVLNLMTLSEKKLSYISLGRITPFTIENMRIIREFFGVVFKIKKNKIQENQENQDEEQDDVFEKEINEIDNQQDNAEKESIDQQLVINQSIFYVLGTGLQNISRITY